MLKKLFSIFGSGKRPPIEVDIKDLAPIWLKYNQEFTPQKEDGAEKPQPPLNQPGAENGGAGVDITSEMQAPLSLFVVELVEPYRHIFESQGSLEGTLKLIELIETHGGCPSVVQDRRDKDSESEDIATLWDILARVTLKEHSFRVARLLLDLTRETYRDFQVMVPRAVITALGHDIGKIPVLRESGLYSMADHPLISARKVREIFSETGSPSLTGVIEAIGSHHGTEGDSWAILLKRADGAAREREIAEVSGELSLGNWEDWFDTRQYLDLIKPHINVVQTANRWNAFSKKGVVYCQPSFLLETARDLASRRKIIDITLLRTLDKEAALRRIADSLRKAGAVGGDLGEGYYGRMYEVDAGKFKRKLFLTPLKAECFGMPSQLERVKEGYLALIKDVKPAR